MSLKTILNGISIIIIVVLAIVGGRFYLDHRRPPAPPVPVPRQEINITIIPGWNLRQIADDWVKKGLLTTPDELFYYTGAPATDYRTRGEAEPVRRIVTSTEYDALFASKPATISYEGYLFPETYRVYADAKPDEVLKKIFGVFKQRLPGEWLKEIDAQGKTFFEILTMASVLEDEVRTATDRKMVADIFWRREKRGMRLQADSTVHYVSARTGDVFTTEQERDMDSPWNTYKNSGLPLGPIGNPTLASIEAAIYPTPNDYFYFLTDREGTVHYSRTYDEHLAKVNRYLR